MDVWQITTGTHDTLKIQGSGPVDGVNCALSSYRAELQGQLTIHIMLTLVIQMYKLE